MPLGRFVYGPLSKYPHMKPEDVAVWNKYIASHPNQFERCDYDVLCGDGAPVRAEDPEEIQRMHTIISSRKIDVVAYRDEVHYVIEVKPIATMSALGQILTYKSLYTQDNPEARIIVPMVVCGEIQPDIVHLFIEHGIVVATA